MKRGFDHIGASISIVAAQRMCLDKRRFDSKNEARDFGKRGNKAFGYSSRSVYKCLICGHFHLSSLSNSEGNIAKGKVRARGVKGV